MAEDFSTRLMTVIIKGNEHQAKIRQQIANLPPMQLEGVAWGSHSEANTLLMNLNDDLHKLTVLA